MCQPMKKAAMDGCTCISQGCECSPSFRRFFSSQEKKERLESYKGQLEKEIKAVDELMNELEG